jgi:hypothetical protein
MKNREERIRDRCVETEIQPYVLVNPLKHEYFLNNIEQIQL